MTNFFYNTNSEASDMVFSVCNNTVNLQICAIRFFPPLILHFSFGPSQIPVRKMLNFNHFFVHSHIRTFPTFAPHFLTRENGNYQIL
jgi:hypothetical protein